MTRSAFGLALFCLVIGALTGSWATFAYTKPPASRSAEEWIAHAKEIELTPCFPDATRVWLFNQVFEEQRALPDAEKAALYAAGRVVTGGHNKGVAVPENCFAVANGLFGFNITYWQRPYVNGKPDMSIPYWNPDPDQIGEG